MAQPIQQHVAPKPRELTRDETFVSFRNWCHTLRYRLSLNTNFAPFLKTTWGKKTAQNPLRGLTNDGDDVEQAARKTAAQKEEQLNFMLEQVASFAPVISRNSIVKNSTSLDDIWQKLRQHYNFQTTGAQFLDVVDIKKGPDEYPEELYERLLAFYEDSLLTSTSGITHHGDAITDDEDLTPTLENTIIVIWLQLIHPGLPHLVKQRYGSELKNKTVASLKEEISSSLKHLLDELSSMEDVKAFRSKADEDDSRVMKASGFKRFDMNRRSQQKKPSRSCTICKLLKKPGYDTHDIENCRQLSYNERQRLNKPGKVRMTHHGEFSDEEQFDIDVEEEGLLNKPTARRVRISPSPTLKMYYRHKPLTLTLDTGANTSLVKTSFAKYIGFHISPATQSVYQADGQTTMTVRGEVHCMLTRNNDSFYLDALVVDDLDDDILAGIPFQEDNDIACRPAMKRLVIKGSELLQYGPMPNDAKSPTVRRTSAYTLKSPSIKTVVLPGEHLEVKAPHDIAFDTEWALEPRFDSPVSHQCRNGKEWPPPQVVSSVGGTIRLINSTDVPVLLGKNEHFCQVHAIGSGISKDLRDSTQFSPRQQHHKQASPFSAGIAIDPDNILSDEMRRQFNDLILSYDHVFNPAISKYNGQSGNIQGVVNMGPVMPPQRKGRVPQYSRNRMEELQAKFDELEASGVFARPEDMNINVEYLNPSFLIQKPAGGSRLVTSFGEVGQYSKPQPSLLPSVDDTLRAIASWKYIIKTDLLKSFYQIPLSTDSMKFCGVATPYKGIRVYTRCAMGMPGSETALEELMSRVLGHLVQQGCVTKIADDLYCGGDTPQEALNAWQRVLNALSENDLRLSASKTTICPKSSVILGWIWDQGTIHASPHRIAALSAVEPPKTVKALRSFIGAYKVLSRVLQGYAELLDPLDKAAAGKESREHVKWDDSLLCAFKRAQAALSKHATITLPTSSDILWIVTDASIKEAGIGATAYILRNQKLLLAGFFNMKLRKHQITWLPCELEALCIGAAVNHFAPYIIQSMHPVQVLTDSRPCVQAYQKLCRGEFSNSARVTTFLSTISRYQVRLGHVSGAANLPSDYASRHPITCPDQSCQLCKFVAETEESVIRCLSVKDVLDGNAHMPYTNRGPWKETQLECRDLRRTHSHLTQGTQPSKKQTHVPDVKKYLKCVRIASDGLLVVREQHPFQPVRERIVVPRSVIHGLITQLHWRFKHPTQFQLKRLATRYFYALEIDNVISEVTKSCHHCAALKSIPSHMKEQTTGPPPEAIGTCFSADVMRRYKQYVLILRETVSSYTVTTIINSEKKEDLREGLLLLCAEVSCSGNKAITIRVDPAPGLVSLQNDQTLKSHGISLEIGRIKNKNKNPIAERAIEEIGLEILHLSPEGGPISRLVLSQATANMNARIRFSGLSSWETWTQRDQLTGEQLPLDDMKLIDAQHQMRLKNHEPSAKAKAHGAPYAPVPDICVGNLVYLWGDRSKTHARDKYIVVAINKQQCQVRKFTKQQFRSKCYDVGLSDCYLVQPTSLLPQHHRPVRGVPSESSSDSDSDWTVPQQSPHMPDHDGAVEQAAQPEPPPVAQAVEPPSEPEPPDELVRPPDSQQSIHDTVDDQVMPINVSQVDKSSRPARSTRGVKPCRYCDKEFVVSFE